MLTKTLAAAAALSMLVAGGEALAAQKTSAAMAGPKQPIPYSQLDAYSKASAKTRASKDWWAGSASTGLSTDASATAPASQPAMPSASMPSMSMPSTSMPDTAVNPAPSAAPPSLPVTPPINATPQTGDPTLPNQPVPGPAAPPTEPK